MTSHRRIVLGSGNIEEKDQVIAREKSSCPVCGSTAIRPFRGGYVCSNCRALFRQPRRTRIALPRRPRYAG